jgi:hypothetical protein
MLSVILLAASILAGNAPEPRERARNHAFELIADLGSPSFKIREKAATELVRLGSAAVDALRKGVNDPDTEIGERCKKLLPQALDFHLQEQINSFLAKPDGPIPEDLPGLRRWLTIAGTSKESRELYASMVKDQRRVLIDVESNPEGTLQRYQAFCRDVAARSRLGPVADGLGEQVTRSELLLFLFLGSDPICRKGNTVVYAQAILFLNSPHLTGMLSGAGASDASKKIFLSWLEGERYLTLVRRGFQLAANADLKEAAPLALKVATDKTSPPSTRSYALLGAAKLFKAADVKDLEKFMDDKTVVGRTALNGEQMTTEIRDIALGIALQATGQQPADYGFERFRNAPGGVSVSYFYYALSEKKREEAHKKWQEWKDKQK